MQKKPNSTDREYTFTKEGQEVTKRESELDADELNYFYQELIELYTKFPLQIRIAFINDIITNYDRIKDADLGVEESGEELNG